MRRRSARLAAHRAQQPFEVLTARAAQAQVRRHTWVALLRWGAGSGSAISSNDQVVGTSETSTGAEDGFSWSNGTMTDLGSNFSPTAVNGSGVIVGGQFVYNGTLQNLNNLIPAGSGYQIQSATGINDNGQIVANAEDTATGQTHALLLNPN